MFKFHVFILIYARALFSRPLRHLYTVLQSSYTIVIRTDLYTNRK